MRTPFFTLPDMLSFEALLQEALTCPGRMNQAYHAFHRYSLNNRVVLMKQLRERNLPIEPVCSFLGWKDFDRSVRKGETALWMWVPAGQQKGVGILLAEEGDTEQSPPRFFFARSRWFSFSQTQGRGYCPELPPPPHWSALRAMRVLGIREIPFRTLDGNVQGYAYPDRRVIAINPLATLKHKTRVHEMAHVLLHRTDTDRPVRKWLLEVEAEAVAYLVLASLGMEGLEESRDYVQGWLRRRSLPEDNAHRIMRTADALLSAGFRRVPVRRAA